MILRHRIARIALIAALLLSSMPAVAESVLLTLTGAVTDGRVDLTRADFDAMDWHELATSTSVTDHQPEFRGVLMRDILARAGAEGSHVRATALNDYVVDIPIEDFHRFDVLAALYMDGVPLTPRDKGPVWIVYPRDDHSVLADIRYDMRWVWQLVALHVQ
ncbi:oxidoreductase [Sinisalibacter aestuarii]|uniref:Oxidoreductase n=2 Tax=Sinisalibacter aestuarii TaxID=2949426 RepID=A0ABQ5LRG6_9RHOB|nr:oxidoreductase [Sinisalibacter aestuarii]